MATGKTATVAGHIRDRIADGTYQPGQRLPRITDLMTEHGIASRSTIDRALRDLVAEGIVDVRHGSGIYVRARQAIRRDLAANLRLEYRRALWADTGEGLFETMTGLSADRVKVDPATYATVLADDHYAGLLGIRPGSQLLVRTYRYRVDGHPHQVARSYLPADSAATLGLTGPDVEEKGVGTIARLQKAGTPATLASMEINARRPTPTETAELQIPAAAPVVEVMRVLHTAAGPAEVSTSVVRADDIRYTLTVDLTEEDSR